MVYFSKLAGAVVAACTIGSAVAHPGEHHDAHHIKREIRARDQMASAAKRSIDSCSGSLKARDVADRSAARRAEVLRSLREKRGIKTAPKKFRRDLATLETYEAIDHNQTANYNYNIDTLGTTIFSANTTCILTPEVTDGPYYVTGEQIRQDVKEDLYSDGVDLYLEVQYLDITTCEPVPGIFVDIWNANATGVYSGVSVSGNYAADGYNSTYLRGIQETDSNGVVGFNTIFPGHYDGRATHTHLLAHMNVSVRSNNTITDGSITHIGQLFWNEELRSAVEAVEPYSSNTQAVTDNADDMWDIVQAGTTYDPFPEYMYLGEDITDGLLAWIQIGVNTTADYIDNSYYAVAAVLQADGGHASADSADNGGGQGGGSGTGNSTGGAGNSTSGGAPSGSAPSGSAPSASA